MGKNVVVAGRSKNVGMPIAMLLHTDGRHERPGGWLQGIEAGRVYRRPNALSVYSSDSLLLQVMPQSPFLTVTLRKSNSANTLKWLTSLWLLQVCAICLICTDA